jgi:hypothetical protein
MSRGNAQELTDTQSKLTALPRLVKDDRPHRALLNEHQLLALPVAVIRPSFALRHTEDPENPSWREGDVGELDDPERSPWIDEVGELSDKWTASIDHRAPTL